MGTCVLVLSVTNFILSYPNTEMDKSMIFVFTSRIPIPHHLRNLQQCEHDVFSYLTSSWRSLYFWDNIWSSVPYHHKCNIECWKDFFWIPFVFCCDDGSPSFYDLFWSELWDLHLHLLPYSSLLLWIKILLVWILSIVWWKRSTSFLHIILEWMSPMILGGHSKWS